MIDVNGAISNDWQGVAFWVDMTAKVTTALSLFVGLLGGWIALRSYQANQRNAAKALIHGLFKDYLRLRFDLEYNSSKSATFSEGFTNITDIAGVQLYVLEEMFYWTESENNALEWIFFDKKELERRKIEVNSWRSTIRTHLHKDQDAIRRSLFGYTSCYGVHFLRFIADDWDEDALSQLVATHERAILMGQERPLGENEPKNTA